MPNHRCNLPKAIKLRDELYNNPNKRYKSNLYYIFYSSKHDEFFMQHRINRSLFVLFDFDNLTHYNWSPC
jgi:hypothetical protein